VNIFEYAMQMEKDGEEYYRQLARQTDNKDLQTILTMLADEEVRHYNTIEKMQTAEPRTSETTILTDVKNTFVQIKESGESFDFDIQQADLYRKAQDIEKKNQEFYTEKADEVTEEYQKELFMKLADEERKHYFLLENIIEFISRPTYRLENAEFSYFEEY
jgi:rubrerythrin